MHVTGYCSLLGSRLLGRKQPASRAFLFFFFSGSSGAWPAWADYCALILHAYFFQCFFMGKAGAIIATHGGGTGACKQVSEFRARSDVHPFTRLRVTVCAWGLEEGKAAGDIPVFHVVPAEHGRE